jgi:gamma-glutamyltranspeptidase/glutathione hydrolase
MLSSMTPTMVIRDGKVVLLTGSPGGRTIINTVLSIVLGVTEYGLTGRAAVDLTRVHHAWLPDDVAVESGISEEALAELRAMGHNVRVLNGRQGDAHSIWIAADGTPYGVPDVRTPDSKASIPAGLTPAAAGR